MDGALGLELFTALLFADGQGPDSRRRGQVWLCSRLPGPTGAAVRLPTANRTYRPVLARCRRRLPPPPRAVAAPTHGAQATGIRPQGAEPLHKPRACTASDVGSHCILVSSMVPNAHGVTTMQRALLIPRSAPPLLPHPQSLLARALGRQMGMLVPAQHSGRQVCVARRLRRALHRSAWAVDRPIGPRRRACSRVQRAWTPPSTSAISGCNHRGVPLT